MRVSRRALVLLLLVSFAGTVSLGALSYAYGTAKPALDVGTPNNQIGDPTDLNGNPQPATQETQGPAGVPVWILLVGALGASGVFVYSFVLFRVEVRKEKDQLRVRRSRESYYRDLKRYNAQLKGPPRKNT